MFCVTLRNSYQNGARITNLELAKIQLRQNKIIWTPLKNIGP
jgi:hypothetical protein